MSSYNQLKERLNRLKQPNNLEYIYTIEELRNKASQLLIKHDKYNNLKNKSKNNKNLPGILKDIVYDYNKLIEDLEIYDDKQILSLKKALELNLKHLYKKDMMEYFPEPEEKDIPTVEELKERLRHLAEFSKTLRKKK